MQVVGIGYDIHKFEKGRKLFIGGVEIPFEMGLAGHSDADVLLHAICDAMLGAVGEGDIGQHFPDSDELYRNISSLVLLSEVNKTLLKKGYTVSNIDSIVIAESPMLAPFTNLMREKIGNSLNIVPNFVNIKATTSEKLGALGRSEGIAAQAIVCCKELLCSYSVKTPF